MEKGLQKINIKKLSCGIIAILLTVMAVILINNQMQKRKLASIATCLEQHFGSERQLHLLNVSPRKAIEQCGLKVNGSGLQYESQSIKFANIFGYGKKKITARFHFREGEGYLMSWQEEFYSAWTWLPF